MELKKTNLKDAWAVLRIRIRNFAWIRIRIQLRKT